MSATGIGHDLAGKAVGGRRLIAVVYADMVGYSRLMSADEVGFVSDLEAVVDAAGLERFALFGISQGCAVSIAYAVRHPERVTRLVLYGGFVVGVMKRARSRYLRVPRVASGHPPPMWSRSASRSIAASRSEGRRAGKEWRIGCRSRGAP